jgi:hypothetical protein
MRFDEHEKLLWKALGACVLLDNLYINYVIVRPNVHDYDRRYW